MNISFSLTTRQFRARIKTETRRLGWKKLRAGQILQACVKCMGLKKGEKIEVLGKIIITHVAREPLNSITKAEVEAEGFHEMTPFEFVRMFCRHMKCKPNTIVTVIAFKYL